MHCWKIVVFFKLKIKLKLSKKTQKLSYQPNTYKANLYFKWFHSYRSDHQVTFIQLHCLHIIKTNEDRHSTELNAIDNLSHAKHHKRTKTSDDIDNHQSHWHKPFFSGYLRIVSRISSVLERWLWSLLIRRRSKLKSASTKCQSHWRIVQLNRRIVLPSQDDMICPPVVIICSDSWIYCLLICTPLSLCQSQTQLQKAFSANAGALSLWQSPPQWVYGTVRVPRNLDSLFYNCPGLDQFPSDF